MIWKKYLFWIVPVILIIVLFVSAAIIMTGKNKNEINAPNDEDGSNDVYVIEIETDCISYIFYFHGDHGTARMGYNANKEVIDAAIEILSGEYELSGTYSANGTSGGPIRTLSFYDEEDVLLYTVMFDDEGTVYVPMEEDQNYYVYTKDNTGSLEFLEEAAFG